MKSSIVPAQITSVEDKIAGNLSFTQLLLMIVPVFVGAGLFVFLPPFGAFRYYKLVIALGIALVSMILAVRIKERLVIEWIVVRARYNLRPRVYVFSKNDMASREYHKPEKTVETKEPKTQKLFKPVLLPKLGTPEVVAFEGVTADPRAEFHFKRNKKGGLSVGIKDV